MECFDPYFLARAGISDRIYVYMYMYGVYVGRYAKSYKINILNVCRNVQTHTYIYI